MKFLWEDVDYQIMEAREGNVGSPQRGPELSGEVYRILWGV